jgi:hypothetical protein
VKRPGVLGSAGFFFSGGKTCAILVFPFFCYDLEYQLTKSRDM